MTADIKFEAFARETPEAPSPAGVYKPILIIDNMAYVSGHGPICQMAASLLVKLGLTLTKNMQNKQLDKWA